MYHDDHNPPHFHAEYQGCEAIVDLKTGEILRGSLPNKARKIIKEWAVENQEALVDNWAKAIELEPLEHIKGADND
ncbi:MAG: DUF4160 domain-containing protein [Sulfurovum sp.]|nr:DUF4160 domain-containing protein [Sulfurovum sp.]